MIVVYFFQYIVGPETYTRNSSLTWGNRAITKGGGFYQPGTHGCSVRTKSRKRPLEEGLDIPVAFTTKSKLCSCPRSKAVLLQKLFQVINLWGTRRKRWGKKTYGNKYITKWAMIKKEASQHVCKVIAKHIFLYFASPIVGLGEQSKYSTIWISRGKYVTLTLCDKTGIFRTDSKLGESAVWQQWLNKITNKCEVTNITGLKSINKSRPFH